MKIDYSQKLWDDTIRQSLQQRRENGGCSMWRNVGIPKLVSMGKFDELLDWEKEWFLDGVKSGKWDGDGKSYGRGKRITEG